MFEKQCDLITQYLSDLSTQIFWKKNLISNWEINLDQETNLISEFVYNPNQQEIASVVDIERTLSQFDLQTLLLEEILNLPCPIIPFQTFDLEEFVRNDNIPIDNFKILEQNKLLSSLLDYPLKDYRKYRKPKFFQPWS